jgi:hypothetical protein
MKPLSEFIKEALRVVELAKDAEITLRIMGACAVRIHCTRYEYLFEKLSRELTDIDFCSYSKFKPNMRKFFEELGYKPREYMFRYWERAGLPREIYDDEKNQRTVDVFYDELSMCHKINFRGRLELDYPTITLSDLLLEKMQIVKLNEKDVKDMIILLREHDIAEKEEKEMINGKYIATLLSKDWCFYYTVTTNLKRVRDFSKSYKALTREDLDDVSLKVDHLLQIIEETPKSLKWKVRQKIGTKVKWYTEVEEVPYPR